MAIAPTEAQLEALRTGDPTERLALVRLLAVRDAGAWPAYLAALDGALKASGGKRAYAGRVDAVLCGGPMRFDWLLIDEFPSRELTLESLRLENPDARALAEAVVVAVRPRGLPRIALALGALAARLFGRGASHPKRALADAPAEDPAISPDPRVLGAYLEAAPDQPFAMLNLNLHRARARYAVTSPGVDPHVSGAVAYRRYGASTVPHLLRRGAGPVFVAEPVGLVVGDAAHPLAAPWNELLLVRYPRRDAMLDMLTSATYQDAIAHRVAGLERAVLIPTTPA